MSVFIFKLFVPIPMDKLYVATFQQTGLDSEVDSHAEHSAIVPANNENSSADVVFYIKDSNQSPATDY